MIEISHISKQYSGNHFKSVDDISLTIADGQITGFIGPNGAGKSTTLKMITGICRPDSGSITLNGFDIQKDGFKAKQQFAYVSDTPDNFLRLKAIEYLNFICDVYGVGKKDRKKHITEMAERFEIGDKLEEKIMSFSHGMRQKIMVIGALVHNPSVWILDEPLIGLDPKAAFTLKEMMKEHAAQGNSVLFSTHVLEVAEKLCDKIAIIRKGRIVFCGTMEEIKALYPQEMSLENIFMEITKDA